MEKIFLKKQFMFRGFSLTEMAIVLGVAGTILSGIWYVAANAYETTRRQQAFDAIVATVNNMRTLYAGQNGMLLTTGSRTLVPQLLANNTIPRNLARLPAVAPCANTNRQCADSPWGYTTTGAAGAQQRQLGSFSVCYWRPGQAVPAAGCNSASGTPATARTQFFAISVSRMPVGACIQVASRVSSALGPLGLLDVNVNGVSMVALGSIAPVPAVNLTANCNANLNNRLTFIYRLQVSG